jgi:hypothetical protein
MGNSSPKQSAWLSDQSIVSLVGQPTIHRIFRFFDLIIQRIMSKLRHIRERLDLLLILIGLVALAWGFYPLMR